MRITTPLTVMCGLALAAATAQTATIANFAGEGTSAFFWTVGLNRSQNIYSADAFTSQGINGPIDISAVEFRMAANLTGSPINYPSVEIYLDQCATPFASPSATFAINRTLAHPRTPNFAGPVTLNAGAGTTPNSWVINIPLTTPFRYDPRIGSLLCEMVILTAPVPPTATVMACTFLPAQGARAMRSVDSTTATTGAQSNFCPFMRISYTTVPGTVALHEAVGAGCVTRSRSFYEVFATGANDLSGQTVTLTQNANGGYDVSSAPLTTFVNPQFAGMSLIDDSIGPSWPVRFTFDFPGGSTSFVRADSNGRVILTGTQPSDDTPTVAELLNAASPVLCPAWQDLLPDGAFNLANVHIESNAAQSELYITWRSVPCFTPTGPGTSTFQVALINNGTNDRVEFRYQSLVNNSATSAGACITGWSRGGGAIDGGSRDITAGLSTEPDALPLALTAAPLPVLGNLVTYTLNNVRPNTSVSAMRISFSAPPAPIPLVALGLNAPDCFAHVNPAALVNFGPLLIGSPSVSFPTTWPVGPYVGFVLYLQGFELAPLENPAGVITSNAVKITLGDI